MKSSERNGENEKVRCREICVERRIYIGEIESITPTIGHKFNTVKGS